MDWDIFDRNFHFMDYNNYNNHNNPYLLVLVFPSKI